MLLSEFAIGIPFPTYVVGENLLELFYMQLLCSGDGLQEGEIRV